MTLDPHTRSPDTNASGDAGLPESHLIVRIFALVLGGLLVGYMFLGRGFAHIGIGPVFVGDWVMFFGVVIVAFVAIRGRRWPPVTWTIALLIAFVALGAVRTFPYLGTHGMDALRDGVLWGYAAFAFIVYLLAHGRLVFGAFRTYGWIVPVFALWLPISWNLAVIYGAEIDPTRPGETIPLVFFKGGDMAVHTVGAIAFLVIGATAAWSVRTFLWRTLIVLPLLWTAFVSGTSNRGALVTAAVGILAVAILRRRSRNWLPFLAATALFSLAIVSQAVLAQSDVPVSSPSPAPTLTDSRFASPSPSPSARPPASSSARAPVPSNRATEAADATPRVEPPAGNRLGVANPGFEIGPVGTDTIDGWTPRGAVASVVEGDAFRGARSASMENQLRAYEATLRSSRFAFTGGKDIAVSAWAKAIAGRPSLEIYVDWFDRSGSLISSDFLSSLPTDGDGTWQECAGVLPAPANVTHAEILFYEASGRATIGIDEVTVRSGRFIPEPVEPEPPKGRPATLEQMIENLLSIFGSSSEPGLEGTRQFRLAWWGTIVEYTVFGEHFWTGKGFGVNLADDDGFQSTADRSLRAPHNSHMTVLARMGVPGFILWLMLQSAFGIGLLRASLAHRRAGETRLAAIGAWVLVYWVAMMVNTSFDPYIEGPQGGIWFWTIFGMGLVIMRLRHRGETS